jgi:hypothetical protein
MTSKQALFIAIGLISVSILTGLGSGWNQFSIFISGLFFLIFMGLDFILNAIRDLKKKDK